MSFLLRDCCDSSCAKPIRPTVNAPCSLDALAFPRSPLVSFHGGLHSVWSWCKPGQSSAECRAGLNPVKVAGRSWARGYASCKPILVFASSAAQQGLERDGNSPLAEKARLEEIHSFISLPALASKISGRPTLLDREANALEGSANFSWRERAEAMNGLLDLLEQEGVHSGYAFEFVRYAGDLVDLLIIEAKEFFGSYCKAPSLACGSGIDSQSSNSHVGIRLETGAVGECGSNGERDFEPLLDMRRLRDLDVNPVTLEYDNMGRTALPLSVSVAIIAGNLGIARLALYFQQIGMKAHDISKLLPFVSREIDEVMAKVEFLRAVGVQIAQLPQILTRCPQLLTYQYDLLAPVAKYLRSLGLSDAEIGKIVTKTPQVLGCQLEELVETVQYLDHLGIASGDFKKLVVRYPILLTDAKSRVESLLAFLEGIGVQKQHFGGLLRRRPVLLESNIERDLMPIGNYLKVINAKPDDIDKIVTSFPGLFCYDLEQDFKPTVKHLQSLGVELALMGKLFRRHPQLLRNRHSFLRRTEYLLSLGLDRTELGKVIYNAPQLLGLSVEENMMPTVKFLQDIGVEGPGLLKVLRLKPMILAYSVDSKLQPNLRYLASIGIKSQDLAKLVTRHPQLLTLSVEKNLIPTVKFLRNLGFSRSEVADMVRRLPSLLGFSVCTALEPKYRYLVDDMKRSRQELVQFPQFFSYSLSKRIAPRFERLGFEQLLCSRSLSSIYGCNDAVFERKLSRWHSTL